MPTSYAGLLSRHAPDGGHSVQAGAIRGSSRRTFEDVTKTIEKESNNASNIIPLSQTDWLPRLKQNLVASTDGKDGGPSPSRLPESSPLPPLDWTPCSQVRLVSKDGQGLEVLEEMRWLPRAQIVEAEAHVGSGHMSTAQELAAAMISWKFPQNPMAPSVVKSMPHEVLQERKYDWVDALCSVYDAYRAGVCPVFYIKSPQQNSKRGSHPDYTVMFAAPSMNGRTRMHAVLSRSTLGFRTLLSQLGIGFEAPLLSKPLQSKDQGNRSVLIFEGARRVHALFDVLLNRSNTMSHDDCDTPSIHAPVSFRNSCRDRLHIREKSNGKNGLHVLEISAPFVAPWVVQRILLVLCKNTWTNLDVKMVHIPDALAMNWSQGSDVRENGTFHDDVEEHRQWKRDPSLYGSALEDVQLTKGMFHPVRASTMLAMV